MSGVVPLTEVKSWLGVSGSDDDALLVGLESRAVAFIEEQTGRHFGESEEHTEYRDGTGSIRLKLREEPDSITSVAERSYPGDDWETIAENDDDGWEQRGRFLLRKGLHRWFLGREYRVIYDFGYEAGTEPEDIRQLVLDLVKLKYDHRDVSASMERVQIGDLSFTTARSEFTADLMRYPWVGKTINAWRGTRVA